MKWHWEHAFLPTTKIIHFITVEWVLSTANFYWMDFWTANLLFVLLSGFLNLDGWWCCNAQTPDDILCFWIDIFLFSLFSRQNNTFFPTVYLDVSIRNSNAILDIVLLSSQICWNWLASLRYVLIHTYIHFLTYTHSLVKFVQTI